MKKALLVIAQDPYLDPRVSNEADNLLQLGYDVDVLGFFNNKRASRSTFNSKVNITEIDSRDHSYLFLGISKFSVFRKDLSYIFYGLAFFFLGLVLFYDLTVGIFLGFLALLLRGAKYLFSRTLFLRVLLSFTLKYAKQSIFARLKNRISFLYSPYRLINLLLPNLVLIGAYERLFKAKHYDLVLCCDLDALAAGAFIKKQVKCHLVYDSHELWPHVYPTPYWLDIKLISWLEGTFIKYADKIITVSNFIKKQMMDSYGLHNIEVIPNVETINESENPSKNKITPKKELNFLFIGGFAQGRGITHLINHWGRFQSENDLPFNLILQGPDGLFKDECIAKASATGLLNKRIFFPASVSEDKILDSCLAADVGLIPYEPICLNHIGCCPNKLGQYLKVGLPILSNQLSYVAEVLAESGAGFVCDFSNYEEFVKSIIKFNDLNVRIKCSESGFAYARAKYNWMSYQDRFLESCSP